MFRLTLFSFLCPGNSTRNSTRSWSQFPTLCVCVRMFVSWLMACFIILTSHLFHLEMFVLFPVSGRSCGAQCRRSTRGGAAVRVSAVTALTKSRSRSRAASGTRAIQASLRTCASNRSWSKATPTCASNSKRSGSAGSCWRPTGRHTTCPAGDRGSDSCRTPTRRICRVLTSSATSPSAPKDPSIWKRPEPAAKFP